MFLLHVSIGLVAGLFVQNFSLKIELGSEVFFQIILRCPCKSERRRLRQQMKDAWNFFAENMMKESNVEQNWQG